MMEEANTVIVTYRVLPDTQNKIRELAKLTFRGLGDTLDWLVSEKWAAMMTAEEGPETLEESVERRR